MLALLTLAAAALAAIIASDFSTAQAQNDDETAGRIVARLLDDGRVEFGWQPTGGERVLPRQRYFPADATVDRWLRSSPVEVGGAGIGRINARLLENGRIEFAFTPTDGERITPQARYFPADARVGRWLRSTEITISPPATSYSAVSAGNDYTCAIRTSDNAIACWGWNDQGQTDAPPGSYSAVSAGSSHTCAIRGTGAIACWGRNVEGQSDAPDGEFTAVSAGAGHTCAIRTSSGEITCWGWDEYGQTDAPSGKFTIVSAGNDYTCAIRTSDNAIACWGRNEYGQSDAPAGKFTAVNAGDFTTCGLRESGTIECWGENINVTEKDHPYFFGQIDAPEDGSFTAVSVGNHHACAIRDTGAIACWGHNQTGESGAPDGSFTAVSVGTGIEGFAPGHVCAIRTDGAIECWGDYRVGQIDPPTD